MGSASPRTGYSARMNGPRCMGPLAAMLTLVAGCSFSTGQPASVTDTTGVELGLLRCTAETICETVLAKSRTDPPIGVEFLVLFHDMRTGTQSRHEEVIR